MRDSGANQRGEHLYALDAVRLFAALAVLIHHWGWVIPRDLKNSPFYPAYLDRYGYLGVELFFLVSGLVILTSAQGASLWRFVAARIVRLYPAFWICCTLSFVVVFSDPMMPTFKEYLVNLTLLPTVFGATPVDDVYWTLVLEVKFYLLVALLLLTGCLRRIEAVLWIWLAVSTAVTSVDLRELVMAKYAAFFVGGCACQLLGQRATVTRWALFVASLAVGATQVLARGSSDAAIHRLPYEPALLVALVACFFLLVLAVSMRRLRLAASGAWVTAGAMSYPIYLLHKSIGYQVFGWDLPWPAPLTYVLCLTWILALSFAVLRWGERPLQAWLRARLLRHRGGGDKRNTNGSP